MSKSLRHYLRAQSQGHHTIDRLEERGVERGSARLTIFLWKDEREGHRQSDEHWNRFKGNAGETSERRGGAHMGFSERIDTIWTELNWTPLHPKKKKKTAEADLNRRFLPSALGRR